MRRIEIDGFDEVYRIECAGSPAFVALHAVVRGHAFGGIRIRRYGGEEEALADALGLSRAMSRKVVLAGIPGGGAKVVLMEPAAERRGAALRALGDFIASLGGRYHSGPDYGFTAGDAAALGPGAAPYHASDQALGPATAAGVLAAMEAAARPRVVAIQGLGAVGRPLAEMLRRRGTRVVASDPRGVPPELGVEEAPPEGIYDVPCDVFAPCAVGGVLTGEAIARLRCGTVCGAANNPFDGGEGSEGAERLRGRGIAYVPDFIANAGAVIHGASAYLGEEARIPERMAAIGDLVREVLARAEREGRSAHAVAIEMADARLARLREGREGEHGG